MRVIIYGPQGSGKSTQAKLLAEKLGVPLIAAGELSRQISQEDTPEGRRTKELVDRGEPTPPEIINPRLEKALSDATKGYILDGFPRYASQYELLIEWLQKTKTSIDKVILIDLPIEEGIKRIMSRAKLEGRGDDTPESIRRRLELYREQTGSIIDSFKTKGIVEIIDGRPGIEEIHNRIMTLFTS